MVPLERWGTVSYLHSIATTTLYCTISEIRQDTGRKMQFFSFPLAFDIPVRGGGGGSCRNIAITFGTEKLEWCGYQTAKKLRI